MREWPQSLGDTHDRNADVIQLRQVRRYGWRENRWGMDEASAASKERKDQLGNDQHLAGGSIAPVVHRHRARHPEPRAVRQSGHLPAGAGADLRPLLAL